MKNQQRLGKYCIKYRVIHNTSILVPGQVSSSLIKGLKITNGRKCWFSAIRVAQVIYSWQYFSNELFFVCKFVCSCQSVYMSVRLNIKKILLFTIKTTQVQSVPHSSTTLYMCDQGKSFIQGIISLKYYSLSVNSSVHVCLSKHKINSTFYDKNNSSSIQFIYIL